MIPQDDAVETYIGHVATLQQRPTTGDVPAKAVGGEFDAVGKLEYYLLRSLGLSDGHLLVDVGCGSGRLACQLVPFERIRYIGTDVVPQLIEVTKRLTKRADWRLEITDGTHIPVADDAADFVTFFSVFTHLRHEQTFRCLCEAARCLNVGGRIVLSFLEFRIPCHWDAFSASLDASPDWPLTQFIDRDAIHAWALHSRMIVENIFDGDKGHIPIPEEIIWENGICMRSLGNLGQSVAVLTKA